MSRAKPTDLDGALATMSAEALREVVHDVLFELDERAHARVVQSLIARAARTGSGWAPAAVSDEQVAEVLAFVKAAERVGQANPSGVDESSRMLVLAAMKKAAERRVAGVTEQKRRRHYGHAAELVATCVTCDESSETAHWAAALRADYRRFHALCGVLDRAMGVR